jgi:transcriptional regulator with XRE-family HTH domain
MHVYEKIHFLRQQKGWSQEDMAAKLGMSVNGYAKIERGETDIPLSRLGFIAKVLEMDLLELFSFGEKNFFYLANDHNSSIQFQFINYQQASTISVGHAELQNRLEKALQLVEQQEREIAYLKEIVGLLKKGGGGE